MARAAAVLEAHGSEDALLALDAITSPSIASYQPYWAVRLEALIRAHAPGPEISEAFARAVQLAADPAVRAHLERRVEER